MANGREHLQRRGARDSGVGARVWSQRQPRVESHRQIEVPSADGRVGEGFSLLARKRFNSTLETIY